MFTVSYMLNTYLLSTPNSISKLAILRSGSGHLPLEG